MCALADMLLPVQKAALGVFTKITQLQQEDLWFELMDVLTGLLRPQQLEQVARSYCTSNAAVHRVTKGDTIHPMEPFSRASASFDLHHSASKCSIAAMDMRQSAVADVMRALAAGRQGSAILRDGGHDGQGGGHRGDAVHGACAQPAARRDAHAPGLHPGQVWTL